MMGNRRNEVRRVGYGYTQSNGDGKVELIEHCGNNECVPADWISPSYVNVNVTVKFVVGIPEDSLQYS